MSGEWELHFSSAAEAKRWDLVTSFMELRVRWWRQVSKQAAVILCQLLGVWEAQNIGTPGHITDCRCPTFTWYSRGTEPPQGTILCPAQSQTWGGRRGSQSGSPVGAMIYLSLKEWGDQWVKTAGKDMPWAGRSRYLNPVQSGRCGLPSSGASESSVWQQEGGWRENVQTLVSTKRPTMQWQMVWKGFNQIELIKVHDKKEP